MSPASRLNQSLQEYRSDLSSMRHVDFRARVLKPELRPEIACIDDGGLVNSLGPKLTDRFLLLDLYKIQVHGEPNDDGIGANDELDHSDTI